MKKEIAIIGACCSRDLFNSKFIPNWKDYFDVAYYSFQTSIISLMSAQVPYNRKLLNYEGDNFSKWYRDILVKEFDKSFLTDLISINPDNILIDFYSDVVNGIIEIAPNTFVTQRLKDQQNNASFDIYRDKRLLTIANDEEEYLVLWKKSVDEFFNFIKENIPNAKIFINNIRFSNTLRTEDGESVPYGNKDVDFYNRVYQTLLEYIKEQNYNVTIIDLEKTYDIDKNYIFGGPWVVHYVSEYYYDLLNVLYVFCKDHDEKDTSTNMNLVLNSDFKNGTLFWKYWDDKFFFSKEDNATCLEIKQDDCETKYAQAISSDVAVESGASYTVEFDYMICSDVELSDNVIAIIRTYERLGLMTKKESIQNIALESSAVRDKYEHMKYEIKPEGKYLSLCLFLTQKGHVKWKNIKIHKKGEYICCNPSDLLTRNILEDLNKAE